MQLEKDTQGVLIILTRSCICEIQIKKQVFLTITNLTKQAIIDVNRCSKHTTIWSRVADDACIQELTLHTLSKSSVQLTRFIFSCLYIPNQLIKISDETTLQF